MKIILAIGTGSFLGGILRYALTQFVQEKYASAFPYGTFLVNMIGCFLIGLVFGLTDRGSLNPEWKLFLATGLIGGFTTFSAFSNETIELLRSGHFGSAALYIAGSLIAGLAVTFLGMSIMKLL